MNIISSIQQIPAHFGRTKVIAHHTFTQLVRMKIFYFLGFFAVILIASNFFNLPQNEGPDATGIHVLTRIKDHSFGAMFLFSIVISIVATALLLPKDMEDRTLYTILAKPVPRIDYLAGKLIGVLLAVIIPLLIMDLLMTGVLQWRMNALIVEQSAEALKRGWSPQDIANLKVEILTHGPTWSLQAAVLAVFVRATIVASMALLISTFSSSTLFTVVISILAFFIGFLQADAREVFLNHEIGRSNSWLTQSVSLLVTLVFPDYKNFNVIDEIIQGRFIPLILVVKLTLTGLFYFVFYLFASWFIFAEKEF